MILALAGCAQFDKQFGQQAALSTGIAPGEVEWARKTGRNTVSGNATLKSGGTTHTCAGQSANLIPDTAYARARMTAIFGNSSRGTRAASLGPVKFERDDPLYVSTLRTARCDASGSFSFPGVPDGVWYATTSVKWQGDLAGRRQLDDAARRRPGRPAGEGHAPLTGSAGLRPAHDHERAGGPRSAAPVARSRQRRVG